MIAGFFYFKEWGYVLWEIFVFEDIIVLSIEYDFIRGNSGLESFNRRFVDVIVKGKGVNWDFF